MQFVGFTIIAGSVNSPPAAIRSSALTQISRVRRSSCDARAWPPSADRSFRWKTESEQRLATGRSTRQTTATSAGDRSPSASAAASRRDGDSRDCLRLWRRSSELLWPAIYKRHTTNDTSTAYSSMTMSQFEARRRLPTPDVCMISAPWRQPILRLPTQRWRVRRRWIGTWRDTTSAGKPLHLKIKSKRFKNEDINAC